ncbi:RNA polymerase sigma factor [Nannocystaceae bacterium ST9]
MSEPDDAELLSRWQAGDLTAGDQLASRYFTILRAYFLTKAPSDYEDLVSATFLRLIDKRGGYRGQASFRVYLFGMARIILLEHFRARRRDDRFEPMQESVAELERGRLSSILAARSRHRLLVDALRRLELGEQELIEFYYWQGLTAREIAEVQGLVESTVRSRIRAALGRIGKLYAELESSAAQPDLDSVEGWLRELQAGLDQLQVDRLEG